MAGRGGGIQSAKGGGGGRGAGGGGGVVTYVSSKNDWGGGDLAFVSRAALCKVVCCIVSGPFLTSYTQVSGLT